MPLQVSAQPLSRRQFLTAVTLGGAATTVLPASMLQVRCPGRHPRDRLADLGLPTLDVTYVCLGLRGRPGLP